MQHRHQLPRWAFFAPMLGVADETDCCDASA
jgi:hypothetical protein